jgi:hypothetical protein
VRAQSPNALQKANDVDPGLVEVARDAFLDLFPNQENISGSFSDFRKVSQVNLTIWVTTVNILFEPQASIARSAARASACRFASQLGRWRTGTCSPPVVLDLDESSGQIILNLKDGR